MRDEMIDVGGFALRVRSEGEGPPMLFTGTGWGAGVDLYMERLGRLRDRFTVAWVDPRRTGSSGRPAADDDDDLDALVDDFDRVRSAFGWDAMWVGGHSMGGHLALRYLARHPDRVLGVLGLCTYGDMDEQYQAEMQARMQARAGEPWFDSVTEAFSRIIDSDAELGRMIMDAGPMYFVDQHELAAIRPELAAVTWSADALPYLGANPSMAVLDQISGMDTPAVLVAAEGDFICSPPLGRRIHQALPNSVFTEIPESGHFPWIEQPGRFWSTVESGLDTFLAPN